MVKELIPAVSSKVKDTVKAQVASSFRASFEGALLPAIEAGVQSMFEQVTGRQTGCG